MKRFLMRNCRQFGRVNTRQIGGNFCLRKEPHYIHKHEYHLGGRCVKSNRSQICLVLFTWLDVSLLLVLLGKHFLRQFWLWLCVVGIAWGDGTDGDSLRYYTRIQDSLLRNLENMRWTCSWYMMAYVSSLRVDNFDHKVSPRIWKRPDGRIILRGIWWNIWAWTSRVKTATLCFEILAFKLSQWSRQFFNLNSSIWELVGDSNPWTIISQSRCSIFSIFFSQVIFTLLPLFSPIFNCWQTKIRRKRWRWSHSRNYGDAGENVKQQYFKNLDRCRPLHHGSFRVSYLLCSRYCSPSWNCFLMIDNGFKETNSELKNPKTWSSFHPSIFLNFSKKISNKKKKRQETNLLSWFWITAFLHTVQRATCDQLLFAMRFIWQTGLFWEKASLKVVPAP